ncbi:uncharacterized protein LOC132727568 isoform X2 [Ruditapes philippinarum]|uniref:uncharacterized protein LOC132727568 isoform X2 n=1 Tax=Ruditapes philippinarum TaxID=129788 RepID=UPI00295B6967|nr:uncharacterized protein LOC132727568 isoform X2 [Ruditapes philippinarum]
MFSFSFCFLDNQVTMLFSVTSVFLLLLLNNSLSLPLGNEPMCSKFAYDEQLLEKMIRQEIKVESMQKDIKKTQENVSFTLEEVKKTSVEVSKTLESLQNNATEVMKGIIRDKERNEEILRKTFAEQRNNFTTDMEEGKKMLKELSENAKRPSVGFFAHNVVDLKLDKTDKIIIFTTATTNEGSGYDNSTGIFTAPVGGLYQFIVNYCSNHKNHAPLGLVLSGNVIVRSSHYDADYYTCSSFSALIRVKSEEKVWVKCLSGSSGYALYQDTWRMNSFSGILVNK